MVVCVDYSAAAVEIVDILSEKERQIDGRDGLIPPIPGSERQEAFDKVIVAIGQKPFARIVSTTTGIMTDSIGYVITESEPWYGMTTRERVFAAGDVAHEPQTVILPMRQGRKVAEAIDGFLQARQAP